MGIAKWCRIYTTSSTAGLRAMSVCVGNHASARSPRAGAVLLLSLDAAVRRFCGTRARRLYRVRPVEADVSFPLKKRKSLSQKGTQLVGHSARHELRSSRRRRVESMVRAACTHAMRWRTCSPGRAARASYARVGVTRRLGAVGVARAGGGDLSRCAPRQTDLGVTRTHSRPHVSNDNPFSEAQFKTLKYSPTFPERFGSPPRIRTSIATRSPLPVSSATGSSRSSIR